MIKSQDIGKRSFTENKNVISKQKIGNQKITHDDRFKDRATLPKTIGGLKIACNRNMKGISEIHFLIQSRKSLEKPREAIISIIANLQRESKAFSYVKFCTKGLSMDPQPKFTTYLLS